MHPLISASYLRALLDVRTPILLLDCRFSLADPSAGERAFAEGHIPGATYAHLNTQLSGPVTGKNGRHPLPSPEAFAATLQAWGLGPQTRVVAYDDQGGMFAARAWWLLKWAGHSEVQVLDGGWKAWQADAGLERTPAESTNTSTAMASEQRDSRSFQPVLVDEVLAHLNQPEHMQLLDARAPDRFRGENETLDPVGGHIPGALNRFFQLNLQSDGRFADAATLRAAFEAVLGEQDPRTVVHQCGSGVTACHNLLAMEVAGLHGSRLYAGSWSEWCAEPSRPVAR
jgi:thiosulfate/3-mercaptopyruvate sulfurtransferase